MTWHPWALQRVLAERPAVRLGQAGSVPGRPVTVTIVTASTTPLSVALVAVDGAMVATTWSRPWHLDPEPTSGLSVHVAQLPAPETAGVDFRVVAGDLISRPFPVTAGIHRVLARDALRVLTLMRSGHPISEGEHPGYGRPAGHVGVPPNTGDVAVAAWTGPPAEQLYPGWRCRGRFDVSGGWYDAGDYGKYPTSGGPALWQLLSCLDLPGLAEVDAEPLRQECCWQLDWMLRMQVPEPDPLAGTVFHRVHGTTWSPLPGAPHADPTQRVLHRPSTTAGAGRARPAPARLPARHTSAGGGAARVAGRTAPSRPARPRRPRPLRRRPLQRRRPHRRHLLGRSPAVADHRGGAVRRRHDHVPVAPRRRAPARDG